jgi:hypothetical protein
MRAIWQLYKARHTPHLYKREGKWDCSFSAVVYGKKTVHFAAGFETKEAAYNAAARHWQHLQNQEDLRVAANVPERFKRNLDHVDFDKIRWTK